MELAQFSILKTTCINATSMPNLIIYLKTNKMHFIMMP